MFAKLVRYCSCVFAIHKVFLLNCRAFVKCLICLFVPFFAENRLQSRRTKPRRKTTKETTKQKQVNSSKMLSNAIDKGDCID